MAGKDVWNAEALPQRGRVRAGMWVPVPGVGKTIARETATAASEPTGSRSRGGPQRGHCTGCARRNAQLLSAPGRAGFGPMMNAHIRSNSLDRQTAGDIVDASLSILEEHGITRYDAVRAMRAALSLTADDSDVARCVAVCNPGARFSARVSDVRNGPIDSLFLRLLGIAQDKDLGGSS